MQIDIKPSDIDTYVKEALINSSIGESVKTVVKRLMDKSYDNPIERELQTIISKLANKLITEQFNDILTNAIQEKINTFFTPERISSCGQSYINHLERILNKDNY